IDLKPILLLAAKVESSCFLILSMEGLKGAKNMFGCFCFQKEGCHFAAGEFLLCPSLMRISNRSIPFDRLIYEWSESVFVCPKCENKYMFCLHSAKGKNEYLRLFRGRLLQEARR